MCDIKTKYLKQRNLSRNHNDIISIFCFYVVSNDLLCFYVVSNDLLNIHFISCLRLEGIRKYSYK